MTSHFPEDASSSRTLSPLESPMVINADGWLQAAEAVGSPNCDARPEPSDVSLLVIHNISLPPGQFGTGCVQQFFCNQLDHSAHPFFREIDGVRVSSHFFIEREGTITQFVATTERAWHAGLSNFEGRERCNDFAVGVELEGTDDQPYTDAQYHSLQAVTQALMARHREITPARVTGHCDISPGRKTDPGPAFDWARFRAGL